VKADVKDIPAPLASWVSVVALGQAEANDGPRPQRSRIAASSALTVTISGCSVCRGLCYVAAQQIMAPEIEAEES
jgi:hypothetical protein